MLEGKWTTVIGAICMVAGAAILFLSWFLFGGVGSCGDPWPGCTGIPFDWHVGLVGMVLVTAGLGVFAFTARRKMKTDEQATPVFIAVMVTFVLFIIITVTVYNPYTSPYDFIRDSDGDGYTDDIDSYPHDEDRYMPTYLQVEITWENTSMNYVARITGVYYLLNGAPTDTSLMQLEIEWAPDYVTAHVDQIGTLKDIDGTWVDGVMYRDNAPAGLFGLNDAFSFDIATFDFSADAYILDDLGYIVTWFHVVV